MTYIMKAFFFFMKAVPLAAFICLVRYGLMQVRKSNGKIEFAVLRREFLFVSYIITVLEITGVIGMQFRIEWFANSFGAFGLYIPNSLGELKMMLLNVILFIPFGIFLPVVFRKVTWNYKKIFFIGCGTSGIIELLQMFGGRMAEVNDVIMNTIGVLVGFGFFQICSICFRKNILGK